MVYTRYFQFLSQIPLRPTPLYSLPLCQCYSNSCQGHQLHLDYKTQWSIANSHLPWPLSNTEHIRSSFSKHFLHLASGHLCPKFSSYPIGHPFSMFLSGPSSLINFQGVGISQGSTSTPFLPLSSFPE